MGLKEGTGTFEFGDGRKYIGEWSKGKMHGQGTFIPKNGKVRIGEWHLGHLIRWIKSEKPKTDAKAWL